MTLKLLGMTAIGVLLYSVAVTGAELPVVRVGSLASGTLDWESRSMRRLGLDEKHGFQLQTVRIASNPGTLVALQGDAVDVIVTDWLWVSNQRARGQKIVAVPFSASVGAVVVAKGRNIRTVGALRGKKLGIAGGPQDKIWLLLQAESIRRDGRNLKDGVDAVFGAPPLIAKKLEQGELDAAILFWQFAAKLNAAGYETLVDGATLMRGIGLTDSVPLLVYAFRATFAEAYPRRIKAFADASYEAKQSLLNSDADWAPLRGAMGDPDEATFHALIAAWRAGVPRHWNEADKRNAEALHLALHKLGGRELVENELLDPGTFWAPFSR